MFGLFGKKTPSTESIVPRIKHTNFLAALKPIAAKDPGSMPVTEPLVADLLITYALDLPGAFKMFSEREFEKSGLTREQLRATAIANLRKQFPRPKLSTKGPLVSLAVGNNLDACLLLIDSVWKHVAANMPVTGNVVVSVPNRDLVLCTGSDSEEGIAKLRQLAKVHRAKEPVHGLNRGVANARGWAMGGVWTEKTEVMMWRKTGRVKWIIGRLAMLASVMLSLATAMMWVRSMRVWDQCDAQSFCRTFEINSYSGRLVLSIERHYLSLPGKTSDPGLMDEPRPFDSLGPNPEFSEQYISRERWPLGDTRRWERNASFFPGIYYNAWLGCARDGPGRFSWVRRVVIPYWLMLILFTCPAALAIAKRFRRRAVERKGLCGHCGYDLRATPERCPECGAVNVSVTKNREPLRRLTV